MRKKTAKNPKTTDPLYGRLIGKGVFIRSVTHHYTGRLKEIHPDGFVLTEAAWIADDGRFADALRTGILNEIEPYPDGEVIVARGPLSDCCHWPHPLPREQK